MLLNDIDEPYYIINLKEVQDTYNRWVKCLPNVKPYYAMKCNPNDRIIKLLASLGCNFDCASKSEIQHILDITNDPSRILFAHPCKYSSHIKFAKEKNVNLMTFDSIEELYKIKEYHPESKLLLRLAVDDSQSLCKFNIKFGCAFEDISAILQTIKDLNLNLIGFSFHVGSGCSSAYIYYDALSICKRAQELAKIYNINISMIDIGGGFVAHNNAVSFEDIAEKIKEAQYDFFENDDIEFIAEPGRFMVQTSHTLIVSVIAKKNKYDEIVYYINDGIYGSFNCMIFDHQKPELIPMDKNNENLYKSHIFGNTCDSMDELYKSILLPELEVNDKLMVKNFGAYTCSAASNNFNGYKITNFIYTFE